MSTKTSRLGAALLGALLATSSASPVAARAAGDPADGSTTLASSLALVRRGEYDRAHTLLTRRLKRAPGDLDAIRTALRLAVDRGRPEFLAEYACALEDASERVDDRLLCAAFHVADEDADAARRALDGIAARGRAQAAEVEYLHGLLALEAGDVDAARAHLRRCLDVHPSHLDGLRALRGLPVELGASPGESLAASFGRWRRAHLLDDPSVLPPGLAAALEGCAAELEAHRATGAPTEALARGLERLGLLEEAARVHRVLDADAVEPSRRSRELAAYLALERRLVTCFDDFHGALGPLADRALAFWTEALPALEGFLAELPWLAEEGGSLARVDQLLFERFHALLVLPAGSDLERRVLGDPGETLFYRVLFVERLPVRGDGEAVEAVYLAEDLGRVRDNRMRQLLGTCLTGRRPAGRSVVHVFADPIVQEYPRLLERVLDARTETRSDVLRRHALAALGAGADAPDLDALLRRYHWLRVAGTLEHELEHVRAGEPRGVHGGSEARALLAEVALDDDAGARLALADLLEKVDRGLDSRATVALARLQRAQEELELQAAWSRAAIASLDPDALRSMARRALALERASTRTVGPSPGEDSQ